MNLSRQSRRAAIVSAETSYADEWAVRKQWKFSVDKRKRRVAVVSLRGAVEGIAARVAAWGRARRGQPAGLGAAPPPGDVSRRPRFLTARASITQVQPVKIMSIPTNRPRMMKLSRGQSA